MLHTLTVEYTASRYHSGIIKPGVTNAFAIPTFSMSISGPITANNTTRTIPVIFFHVMVHRQPTSSQLMVLGLNQRYASSAQEISPPVAHQFMVTKPVNFCSSSVI